MTNMTKLRRRVKYRLSCVISANNPQFLYLQLFVCVHSELHTNQIKQIIKLHFLGYIFTHTIYWNAIGMLIFLNNYFLSKSQCNDITRIKENICRYFQSGMLKNPKSQEVSKLKWKSHCWVDYFSAWLFQLSSTSAQSFSHYLDYRHLCIYIYVCVLLVWWFNVA